MDITKFEDSLQTSCSTRLLSVVGLNVAVSWKMLDCFSAVQHEKYNVKKTTIANCFQHCGFIPISADVDDYDFVPENDLSVVELDGKLISYGRGPPIIFK